ncbi:kinase-like domain-containing protein, partial [Zopfochytrium polystomum]
MDTVDPAAIIGSTLVDSTGHHAVVLTSLIGSGSFAHVYLAEEVPSLGQQPERRAVKRLFKEGLDERQLILQRQEAEVMKSIEPHQNIIRLLATVEDDECLYLIMEYYGIDPCGSTDLYEAITQQGGFPDDVVKEVFGQIADAVIHCHASGFYHRDLKPENCLISADYKVKLADFGLATADPWSSEMGCGSVRYMAPECFDPLHNAPEPADNFAPPPSDALGYSPPANDVWALGVILINLLFGKNPWFEAHKSDAIFSAYCSSNPNILRQQFNLSPQFDAVLRRAFELDPLRRCSVADLKHMVESMTSFVGTP